MTDYRWPEIVTERRETIATRTAEGAECTLIALRRRDGQLGLYLHGGIRCSVLLPPPVHAKLVAALARAGLLAAAPRCPTDGKGSRWADPAGASTVRRRAWW